MDHGAADAGVPAVVADGGDDRGEAQLLHEALAEEGLGGERGEDGGDADAGGSLGAGAGGWVGGSQPCATQEP